MDPWNFRAPFYNRVRRLWPINLILKRENANIDFLLSQIEPGGRTALDVGCGTGNGMMMVKKRMKVIGIDRSPGMAAIADRFHRGSVICGEVEKLPIKPGVIDLFVVIGLVEYLQNPSQLFDQLASVGRSRCLILATSSPANAFAMLRQMTGIRLWPRRYEEIISLAEQTRFTLVERRSCWTQDAFLFVKRF
jgi:ubiquinone/menaquinone biosynthesis C-methylase UbiE